MSKHLSNSLIAPMTARRYTRQPRGGNAGLGNLGWNRGEGDEEVDTARSRGADRADSDVGHVDKRRRGEPAGVLPVGAADECGPERAGRVEAMLERHLRRHTFT